ncbi:hypothetical protein FACS1894180_0150 [Bacteroidia bacterium]|nr:hypothetical protein FACS1894180_0150 [Bacteroidia bacterium]
MMSAAVVATSCKKDKDKDEDKTVPVTDITLTSAATIVAGEPLTLVATVAPATATNKTIVWTVKSAGSTGATIDGSVLTVPTAGTATVTATIAGGLTATTAYTKDFDISVTDATPAPTLSLTPAEQTAIAFAADGTTADNTTFTVTTNTGGYEAVASASWVTVTKTGNSFTVSATPQPVDAEATVTVSASGADDIVLNLTIEGLGVEINGVVWSPYNVDAVGTFATTPEAPGKFYQWNRNVAWDATGDVSGWDDTDPEGDSWTTANDPSPEGWRVPTQAELESLLDLTKVSRVWTTQNGVNGRLFTDIASGNTLFLSVTGSRFYSNGTLNYAETGYYWSSTADGTTTAYYLRFSTSYADCYSFYRRYGNSVRSVAE